MRVESRRTYATEDSSCSRVEAEEMEAGTAALPAGACPALSRRLSTAVAAVAPPSRPIAPPRAWSDSWDDCRGGGGRPAGALTAVPLPPPALLQGTAGAPAAEAATAVTQAAGDGVAAAAGVDEAGAATRGCESARSRMCSLGPCERDPPLAASSTQTRWESVARHTTAAEEDGERDAAGPSTQRHRSSRTISADFSSTTAYLSGQQQAHAAVHCCDVGAVTCNHQMTTFSRAI